MINFGREKITADQFEFGLSSLSKRARKALENAEKIDMSSFSDLYGKEAVNTDLKYVKKLKQNFAEQESAHTHQARTAANILEAMILEQAELSDWLGEEAHTIKTCEYDDFKNGVDIVVEYRKENATAHMGMAIDVTYSNELSKKFDRIKWEIENGNLAKIKYFASEHINFRGELSNIPRVVVGASIEHAKETGELWVNNKRKELGVNPMQILILLEIYEQLEVFKNYAKKKAPESIREKILTLYEAAIERIGQILEDKQNQGIELKKYDNDAVLRAIKSNIKNFT